MQIIAALKGEKQLKTEKILKAQLHKYTDPISYEKEDVNSIEHHSTVKEAIERVRSVRKSYRTEGVWVGWKIFDKNNELVHKLR